MPRKTAKSKDGDKQDLDIKNLQTPALESTELRMSYLIARGEQGVLSFRAYKSILLPYWRFKTVLIAEQSSKTLKQAFDHYVSAGDLVGADMARKFIQMGMTRAKRYAPTIKLARSMTAAQRKLRQRELSGRNCPGVKGTKVGRRS